MKQTQYEITESVTGFTEGDILDVTARFGDWHTYELKLEARPTSASRPTKVIVSDGPSGFSESEILDPTARFGDWHSYELAFEPVGRSTVGEVEDATSSGPIRLTSAQFRSIARPVEA